MPAPERTRARRRPDVLATVTIGCMVLVATGPLLRVVSPGLWQVQAMLVLALVLASACATRALRVPAVLGSAVGLLAAVAFLAWTFGSDAIAGFIPTADTAGQLAASTGRAVHEIMVGVAPLDVGVDLAWFLVSLVALLTVVVDLLVNVLRLPLIGSVLVIIVSIVPTYILFSPVDLVTVVLLTVLTLVLLRLATRRVERAREPGVPTVGVTAVAASSVVIALLATITVAPLIPTGSNGPAAGFGTVNSINPNLDLGVSLRQPVDTPVIRVRSDMITPPYLRLTTLTRFDGDVWARDDGDEAALAVLGEATTDAVMPGVTVTEYRTNVEVDDLNSSWLPVPYPAIAVNGVSGDWRTLLSNRSVITSTSNAAQQRYEIVSQEPRPSLEQIRATSASGDGVPEDASALPDVLPARLGSLALEVTADATNDYDRLLALQRWFRSDFRYSLEAPVENGFDGSNIEAIDGFLDRRSGYCVHFSSTFALMARFLGMPSRVVVGFLPGTSTDDVVDDQRVYSVSTSQLHAWPEVFFDGIGWIAFEPTASLGVPTAFTPENITPPAGGRDVEPAPEVSAAPTAAPSVAPTQTAPSAQTTTETVFDPTGLLVTVGVLAGLGTLLAVPALVRGARRADRIARARTGDATAAWRELQDTVLDLGIAVPAAESPRVFADRLARVHHADRAGLDELVDDIEWTSYAGAGHARFARGAEMSAALEAVLRSLRIRTPRGTLLTARFLPRSLVVRPGRSAMPESVSVRR